MSRRRAAACLAAGLWLAACSEQPHDPVAHAQRWLWRQQGRDGLVHSDVYGVLRAGESLTAAALLATGKLSAAARAPHADAVQRAFDALQRASAGERPADTPLDYPCYTAAHHLQALVLLAPDGWREQAGRRIEQLRALQCSASNGWTEDALVFGGFGLGDGPPVAPRGADLVTLSATTAVLEAVRAAGLGPEDPLVRMAQRFVERCQHFGEPGSDGSFCGTPGGGALGGKGGLDAEGRPRGYGTATADGVRALLACGHAPTSARVSAAVAWLEQRAGDVVPGLGPEFEPSLRLYWAAALAEAGRALGRPLLPASLHTFVLGRQRADGAFVGLGSAMKEDDPTVATTLALLAGVGRP